MSIPTCDTEADVPNHLMLFPSQAQCRPQPPASASPWEARHEELQRSSSWHWLACPTANSPQAHPAAEGDPTPRHSFATSLTQRQLSPHAAKSPLNPISKSQNITPLSATLPPRPQLLPASSRRVFLAGTAHAGCQAGAGPGAHISHTPTLLWTSRLQSCKITPYTAARFWFHCATATLRVPAPSCLLIPCS